MAFKFTCKSCGFEIVTQLTKVGYLVKCEKCNINNVIPRNATAIPGDKKSKTKNKQRSDDKKDNFKRDKKAKQKKYIKKSDLEHKMGKILELEGKIFWVDIKKQYKNLMKQYHPDKVENLGKELKDLSKRKTIEIMEAYEYFKNKYGS